MAGWVEAEGGARRWQDGLQQRVEQEDGRMGCSRGWSKAICVRICWLFTALTSLHLVPREVILTLPHMVIKC